MKLLSKTLVLVLVLGLLLPTLVMAQDEFEGYIRYPITIDPEHLDPFTSNTIAIGVVANPIWEGLLSLDPATGEVKPAIAESWEISEDADGHQVFTYHIRDGVMFHDVAGIDYGEGGREVTADDVLWSYMRALNGDETISTKAAGLDAILGAAAYTAGEAEDVPGLVVVDEKTFQIILEVPDRLFLINGNKTIVPRELHEQLGDAAYNIPVSTGPFQFVEWLPENRIVLEANPDYYLEGQPKAAGIVYTNYGDANTALLDYREGKLDFLFSFPSGQRQAIIDEFGAEFNEIPGYHIRYWGFHMAGEGFMYENPLVRQAFSLALDRDTAWNVFAEGARFPADQGMLPPSFPASSPATPVEFNLEKAAELLAEAGFPNGEGMPVIKIYLYEPIAEEAQVVLWQQALESLGVQIEFVVEGGSAYWDSIESVEAQVYQTGWSAGIPDPSEIFNYLVLDGADNGGYNNEDVNVLIRAAMVELDPAARNEIYQQVHDMVMADAAFVPSAYSKVSWLQKPWVSDFVPGGNGTHSAPLDVVDVSR